ncbi:MAG: ribonuclease E/G [Alphaproteobacteria bacterium]|nr:ribonuclease E/G [Alphaproteobacteria bacterium]
MSGVTLTCDRQDGLRRVAVWKGRELRDLYLEKIGQPDFTGAVVAAKVARLASGQKAAWMDAGLGEMIYVENPGTIRSGISYAVQLTTVPRQGKAWGGILLEEAPEGKSGILIDPPFLWQRAIDDVKDEKLVALSYADREDRSACEKWLSLNAPQLLSDLQPLAKEPVHPELDDIIDGLKQSTVNLPGGGNIVIEQTEALVAVDVNGGEMQNPLAVNLLAAKEIARQIRWRNLSGIIVIDALKMKMRPDKAKVLNALANATANDPAGVQVFGMTKLGLIEMTRKRRGYSLMEIMT